MVIKLFTLYLSLVTMSGLPQVAIKSRVYGVDDFNRIVTYGAGNLNIEHSDKYTLEVHAINDCIELVEISVLLKTLYFVVKDSKTSTCNCTIDIGVPAINELVQNGGGNIVFKKDFSPANSFDCKIKRGGNIDVSLLSVDSFYASIQDGGEILLNAQMALEGNISGGGLIEYLGDPTVKSSVSGGGAIRMK